MKRVTFGILLASTFFFAGTVARAADCSYCAKLEALKKGFSSAKVNSQNEKEIDRKLKLLDDTQKLAIKVLGAKASPVQADWERLLGLLAAAEVFDSDNTLAEEVSAGLCPGDTVNCARLDQFHDEIERQKKAGVLSDKQAEALHTAYGIAESTREHGTDGDESSKKNH